VLSARPAAIGPNYFQRVLSDLSRAVRRSGMSQGRLTGLNPKPRRCPMRVMVVVKATAQSESGVLPEDGKVFEEMGKFNDELIAAGVMIDAAGLKASSHGKRLTFNGGKALITDGPFAETKELIAGYWVWNVKNLAEATEWASRAPMQDGATLELRPFFEPEDFAGLVSPEIIEQEKGWREDSLARAPKAN
jgi:hypothetical protein